MAFEIRGGVIRTVDGALAVGDDLADLSLLLEVSKSAACERAVDLETIDEGGDGHQAVRLDILLELVVGGLVEDDGVLGLVLDCVVKQMSAGCFSLYSSSCASMHASRIVVLMLVLLMLVD